jgi:hypothetical protein
LGFSFFSFRCFNIPFSVLQVISVHSLEFRTSCDIRRNPNKILSVLWLLPHQLLPLTHSVRVPTTPTPRRVLHVFRLMFAFASVSYPFSSGTW